MQLFNKYRPKTPADFVGDYPDIISRIDRGVGSFIFYSDNIPGVGKTSMARAIANHYATALDITEINCATDGGIDTIREVLDFSRYAPKGKKRFIILDEAHKLTSASWEALKVPLEEPPKDTVFILCTTEIDRIPKISGNRCSSIQFNPLTDSQLELILSKVLRAEGIEVSLPVIDLIIAGASGSARAALLKLDEVLAESKDKWIEVARKKTLYAVDDEDVRELAQLVYGRASGLLNKLVLLRKAGVDVEAYRRALYGYGVAILVSGKYTRELLVATKLFASPYFNGVNDLILSCIEANQIINKDLRR